MRVVRFSGLLGGETTDHDAVRLSPRSSHWGQGRVAEPRRLSLLDWREVRHHYRATDRARIALFDAIELDLSLLWSSHRRA
jgi:hypothetical protein